MGSSLKVGGEFRYLLCLLYYMKGFIFFIFLFLLIYFMLLEKSKKNLFLNFDVPISGNYVEAIEKLQKVENFKNSILGVRGQFCLLKSFAFLFQFILFGFLMKRLFTRGSLLDFVVVAAMEALAGLYLQLGQVSCDQ